MHRSAAPLRRLALAAPCVPGLATTAAPARAGDGFSEIVSKYRAYRNRPSLFMRTRSRIRLTETHDPPRVPPPRRRLREGRGPRRHGAVHDGHAAGDAVRGARHDGAICTGSGASARRTRRTRGCGTARGRDLLAGIAEAQAAVGGPLFDPFLRAAALKALVNLGRPEANRPRPGNLIDDPPKDPFAQSSCSPRPRSRRSPRQSTGRCPPPRRGWPRGDRPSSRTPRLPRRAWSSPATVARAWAPSSWASTPPPTARVRRREGTRRLAPQAPRRALRPRPLLRPHDDGPLGGLYVIDASDLHAHAALRRASVRPGGSATTTYPKGGQPAQGRRAPRRRRPAVGQAPHAVRPRARDAQVHAAHDAPPP